jgi:hypothetical protein
MIEFKNVGGLIDSLTKHIDKTKKEAERIRREATAMFLDELLQNIPVWSGRTIRSIRITNDGSKATLEGDPPRSLWHLFGRTRVMKMGSEPMRASSEGVAKAQITKPDYSFDKDVYITIHSVAWGLVEQGKAPDGRGRNKAVVSAIAKQRVRSKFPQLR